MRHDLPVAKADKGMVLQAWPGAFELLQGRTHVWLLCAVPDGDPGGGVWREAVDRFIQSKRLLHGVFQCGEGDVRRHIPELRQQLLIVRSRIEFQKKRQLPPCLYAVQKPMLIAWNDRRHQPSQRAKVHILRAAQDHGTNSDALPVK